MGKVYSVSEITMVLKECLDGVPFFNELSVRGEVSNFKRYAFGCYFDIKDENCPLPCVYFAKDPGYHSFQAKNGDQLVLTGRLSVYPKQGRYQFYVKDAKSEGTGSLIERREALKKKLAGEGLFDESRKRKLPPFPRRVGIVTACPSAALSDIVRNTYNRYPLAELIVYPALVQGDSAPNSLINAISLAQRGKLDILIIARGGGSLEDLAAFDDEKVVRAVASSSVVTVTAIGHEIDFTLVDFVSDKRVSTPTAAAASIFPDLSQIQEWIYDEERSLFDAANRHIIKAKEKLGLLSSRPYFLRPEAVYGPQKDRIENLTRRLENASSMALERNSNKVDMLSKRLTAIDPGMVLKRGYSISLVDGKPITSVAQAHRGQVMETRLSDGIIHSEILEE